MSCLFHKPKKNLVSVHRLAKDNNVFLKFHPNFFLIKDQDTRSTILKGRCHKGLYPLPVAPPSVRNTLGVNKPSFDKRIAVWVILQPPLFKKLSVALIFLVMLSLLKSQCVTLVNKQKVTNYLILSHLVSQIFL
jgi:hypothetical protein